MWGVILIGFKKILAVLIAGYGLVSASSAQAMTLVEAVQIAVSSNPEIGEAISNREAIEFELEQGRGLFRPKVDLEARIGGEKRWREVPGQDSSKGWLNNREASSRCEAVVIRRLRIPI